MSVISIATSCLLAIGLWAETAEARPPQLTIELIPSPGNPTAPRMGNALAFRAVIHNDGQTPIARAIAWVSLLDVDPGKEQPVDLEDWSAQKAVILTEIAPGQTTETEWRLRLIQSGSYQIAVTAAPIADAVDSNSSPVASPFVAFTVESGPVVETGRVLPVAAGLPLAIGAMLLWRGMRGRRTRAAPTDAGR